MPSPGYPAVGNKEHDLLCTGGMLFVFERPNRGYGHYPTWGESHLSGLGNEKEGRDAASDVSKRMFVLENSEHGDDKIGAFNCWMPWTG
jgi:hypothetical protein